MLMKKLFTLGLFLLATAWAMAQDSNTFQFVDKDGNGIEDGATVNATTVTYDDFGMVVIPSGISVKNISTDDAGIRIRYTIETLDNGNLQICFPINCITKTTTGNFVTESDLLGAGQTRDMQTEWCPTAYGNCKVTYQIELMTQTQVFPPKFEFKGKSSEITVVYNYADPSGIKSVDSTEATTVIDRYTSDGRRLTTPQSGLNIVRLKNGQVVKTIGK